MRKDPTQFRERFKAYKEGRFPYKNGKILPEFEDGKDYMDSFIDNLSPILYEELDNSGISNINTAHDNMLRQLAYESNYGRSNIAKTNHNYGGVGYNGKTYFKYNNDREFIRDYVNLMNTRYSNAVNALNIQDYSSALKKGGYYESSLEQYTKDLIGMKTFANKVNVRRLSNKEDYTRDLTAPRVIRGDHGKKMIFPRGFWKLDDPVLLKSQPNPVMQIEKPVKIDWSQPQTQPVYEKKLPEIIVTGDSSKYKIPTISEMISSTPLLEHMKGYFRNILGLPQLKAPYEFIF